MKQIVAIGEALRSAASTAFIQAPGHALTGREGEEDAMDEITSWRWLEAQLQTANGPADPTAASRAAPAAGPERRSAGAGGCCGELQLEPCYPYAADWRLRCRGCGRWCSPGEALPDGAASHVTTAPTSFEPVGAVDHHAAPVLPDWASPVDRARLEFARYLVRLGALSEHLA
jgi:hypothetical protein